MSLHQINEFSSLDQFAESQSEGCAYKQTALDLFYRIGCQYSINHSDMRQLCELACINYDDLQKYSGVVCQ